MESITVDELKKKVSGSNPVNIVDVRINEGAEMGVIPGAKIIPTDKILDNLKEFNKNDMYYVVCAVGSRSAKVASYLEEQGVHAVNAEDGMNAWDDEGTVIDNI